MHEFILLRIATNNTTEMMNAVDMDKEITSTFHELVKIVKGDDKEHFLQAISQVSPANKPAVLQFQDDQRKTILHHCVKESADMFDQVLGSIPEHERLDFLLLQEGTEHEGLDAYGGDTVLHLAVRAKNCNIVKLILSSLPENERSILIDMQNHCVDIDEIPPSSYGSQTALHMAADSCVLTQILLSSIPVSKWSDLLCTEDAVGDAPIHLCSGETLGYILSMLSCGDKLLVLSVTNGSGNSRLMMDVKTCDSFCVKLIINILDVAGRLELLKIKGHEGKNALHMVASEDTCQYILDCIPYSNMVALVKSQDHDGNTVIHNICSEKDNCRLGVLEKLLDAINPIDRITVLMVKNSYGFTALHTTVLSGLQSELKAILQALNSHQRIALLKVLVAAAEAGGLEVRNQHFQKLKPSNKANDRQYLDNSMEINRRLSIARQQNFPAHNVSEGDSALHYAIILKDEQMRRHIMDSLDSENRPELYLIKDVDGYTCSELYDRMY